MAACLKRFFGKAHKSFDLQAANEFSKDNGCIKLIEGEMCLNSTQKEQSGRVINFGESSDRLTNELQDKSNVRISFKKRSLDKERIRNGTKLTSKVSAQKSQKQNSNPQIDKSATPGNSIEVSAKASASNPLTSATNPFVKATKHSTKKHTHLCEMKQTHEQKVSRQPKELRLPEKDMKSMLKIESGDLNNLINEGKVSTEGRPHQEAFSSNGFFSNGSMSANANRTREVSKNLLDSTELSSSFVNLSTSTEKSYQHLQRSGSKQRPIRTQSEIHKVTHKNVTNAKDSSKSATDHHNSAVEKVKIENDSGINIDAKISDGSRSGDDEARPSQEDILNTAATTREGHKEGVIFTRREPRELPSKDIKVYAKDEKTRKLIRGAIEENDFLNNYMDKERKFLVIDAMEPKKYKKGSYIIRENEEGSEIYVSEEGTFEVLKKNAIINALGPGKVFGELAILYNAKRFASIRAATDAKVWKIHRSKFRAIMLISGSKEKEENLNFLKSVPLLKDLPEDILLKIVDLLNRIFFPTNTRIVRQGDIGNDFYIIRGGSVTIKKTNDYGEERIVARRKRGDYFGEQALINAEHRLASVYADAPGTECLKLDREAFISYLGTIPELKEKPIDQPLPSDADIRIPPPVRPHSNIRLKDLRHVGILGIGGFGRVELVSYNDTQAFALKVLKKTEIIKQEQIEHVYSEKMVMSLCHSPFIVELYTTFRDNKYVYFLMEACLGGDVWTIMHQKQYFEEKASKFIAGCVVEAFDYLHSRNIIFRDLKPENLMLTPDGYCKLVDFGFAKRIAPNYKTNTFAGTPEYVAPEIILDRGHDRAVDYWALGILIHELLCGRPPFRGRDQMKIYQQILGGIENVKMSSRIHSSARSIIKHLCKSNPAERLGYQRKGIADIKKHSWFDGFEWYKLQTKTMPAPFERPINNIFDLRYFFKNYEEEEIPADETSGWDAEF